MAETSKKSGILFVAVALFLGIVTGVATVYFSGGFDGNGDAETKTANAIPSACILSDEQKAALDAAATGDLAAMRIADKPIPLANISFQMPNGEAKTFASFKDQVILLNLWATWCGPCREEMPDLANMQVSHGSDKFKVVALNVDRNGGSKPQKFLDDINAKALDLYIDPANKTFQALRSKGLVFGLPTTMILDAHGCVQGVLAGIAHWGSDDAKNLVEVATKTLSIKGS